MTGAKRFIQDLLENFYFEFTIAGLTLVNAVAIGVELSYEVEGKDTTAFKALDNVILSLFVVELLLRFYGCGIWGSWRDPWVRFDGVVIVLGITGSWLVIPLASTDVQANVLGSVSVFRSLRLLRLLRVVRLRNFFSQFGDLLVLLRGILHRISLLFYTFLTLFVCIYILACLGMELITKHALSSSSQVYKDHVMEHFPTLPQTMLTLVRFATLDNIAEVYTVPIAEDPFLVLYFAFAVFVISFMCVNLITAIIVTAAGEQGLDKTTTGSLEDDEEMVQLLNDLKKMFIRLDRDGSGQISREEIKGIHASDMEKLERALGFHEPVDVFRALDVDNSGELSIAEFFDGVLDIMLRRKNDTELVQMKRLERTVDAIHRRLKSLGTMQQDMDERIEHGFTNLSELRAAATPGGGGQHDAPPLTKAQMRTTMRPMVRIPSVEAQPMQRLESAGFKPQISAGWGVDDSADSDGLTAKLQKILEQAFKETLQLSVRQLEEMNMQTSPSKTPSRGRRESSKNAIGGHERRSVMVEPGINGSGISRDSDESDSSALSGGSSSGGPRRGGLKKSGPPRSKSNNSTPRSNATIQAQV